MHPGVAWGMQDEDAVQHLEISDVLECADAYESSGCIHFHDFRKMPRLKYKMVVKLHRLTSQHTNHLRKTTTTVRLDHYMVSTNEFKYMAKLIWIELGLGATTTFSRRACWSS